MDAKLLVLMIVSFICVGLAIAFLSEAIRHGNDKFYRWVGYFLSALVLWAAIWIGR
jgi:hypothetical protein